MNATARLVVGFLILIQSQAPVAYELYTHGFVTWESLAGSTLKSTLTQKELGLGLWGRDLGKTYFDITGSGAIKRVATSFGRKRIRHPQQGANSIGGWVARGAVREDDTPFDGNPKDDPVNATRVFNHFYDPVYDRPLTVLGGALGQRSPDWGLGSGDAFAAVPVEDGFRENHFTFFDAREAMFRALTGKDKNGNFAGDDNGPRISEADRKAYWATVFRTVGNVVHLIQDAAQPQHTRNDAHAGGKYDGDPGLSGHASVYEIWVENKIRKTRFNTSSGQKVRPSPLGGGAYPAPTFHRFSDYFSTEPGGRVVDGRGVADYSNRGFFSQGKNMDNPEYGYPIRDESVYDVIAKQDDYLGELLEGAPLFMLHGAVDDRYTGLGATGVPLTSRGLWDQFLEQEGQAPRYTLNFFNYDAMADLLIPRAIGYSAGLINYFFRGRMEIQLPDEGVYAILDHSLDHSMSGEFPTAGGKVFGFETVKLKVRNATPAIIDNGQVYPQTMGAGKLYAVAKYRPNPCYENDLSGEASTKEGGTMSIGGSCDLKQVESVEEYISVSAPIPISGLSGGGFEAHTFDFANDPIPVNAVDLYLQVVFRGELGSEKDAVVVTTKDVFEPTAVAGINSSDYMELNDRFYLNTEVEASDQLKQDVDDAGNRDNEFNELLTEVEVKDYKIFFNYAPDPVVTLADLPVGRFFRVLVLTDQSSPVMEHLIPEEGSSQLNWLSMRSALDANGTFQTNGIEEYGPFRGMHWKNLHAVARHYNYGRLVTDFTSMADLTNPLPLEVNIDF